MARLQTTKQLARRINPLYFRRPSTLRGMRGFFSFMVAVVAVSWWVLGGTRGHRQIFNPGHVSLAHAMWENDCAKCHDNDGKGGFRGAVSDHACLQCHDAAAHHRSQLLQTLGGWHGSLAMAVMDSSKHLRSADCVACHSEHRGHVALALLDDSNCTKCHGNVVAALAPGATPTVAQSVTAFNARGGHPYFGAMLASARPLPRPPATLDAAILVDPTHLKFNHKTHMQQVPAPAGTTENCSVCHSTRNRDAGGKPGTLQPSAEGSGKYMQPIRYARDCASCHSLKLPSGLPIAHVRLDLLLGQLSNPERMHRQWLAQLSEERQLELTGEEAGDRLKKSLEKVYQSAGDWLAGVEPKKMPGAEGLADKLQKDLSETALTDPKAAGADVRVVSAFVAYGMTGSCAKCHDVQDNSPVAATAPSPAARALASEALASAADAPAAPPASAPATEPAPSTQPAAAQAMPALATIPTGIPQSPRRWFTRALFNHKPHQNMTCVSCHARAPQSEKTSDVLSPNLTWTSETGAMASCVQCHHPSTADSRGAGARCVTCHAFHDASLSSAPAKPGDPFAAK